MKFLSSTNKMDKFSFIAEVAYRAGFAKSDVEIILNTMIRVFAEAVNEEIIVKISGLGKLFSTELPERKGSNGQILPATMRTTFRLSEGIKKRK